MIRKFGKKVRGGKKRSSRDAAEYLSRNSFKARHERVQERRFKLSFKVGPFPVSLGTHCCVPGEPIQFLCSDSINKGKGELTQNPREAFA